MTRWCCTDLFLAGRTLDVARHRNPEAAASRAASLPRVVRGSTDARACVTSLIDVGGIARAGRRSALPSGCDSRSSWSRVPELHFPVAAVAERLVLRRSASAEAVVLARGAFAEFLAKKL